MTETINGLLTQKPGREPEPGQTKCFSIEHKPAVNGKKAWIKVKNATPDKGGEMYRIVNAEPTGFTDSYGNVSFSIELEKVATPTPPAQQNTATGPQNASTGHPDDRSHRIERQSARRDAIEFHRLECTLGAPNTAVDLNRVKELMGIFESWLNGEEPW